MTIAVIGGGSAGFTAAKTAARLGARVLFFMGDNADHASLCINAGCMPSKALFQPIDEMHHACRREYWRIEPVSPAKLLADIVAWKDREIEKFRAYRQQEIRECESANFIVVRANARFVDAHTVEAAGKRYRADTFILATGSTPRRPPLDGLKGAWTSAEILQNTTLPASLAVIGGGPVGLEFALRYARLGCRVTLITRSRLLSQYDAHFGERLAAIYERENIRVLTGYEVQKVSGHFAIEAQGPTGTKTVTCEKLLLATGRRPALESLNLEAAGIPSKIEVDKNMRVAGHRHIFAVGDVNGRGMVVHRAHLEGDLAARNAIDDGDRRWPHHAELQVAFTDPQFAFAGIPASKAGQRAVVAREESRDIGKLHLAGDDHGFGELIADAQTHRLLGCGLLCADASELIHLPGYAIAQGHTVEELANAEYYHPTKSELVASLTEKFLTTVGDFHRAESEKHVDDQ